MIRVLDDKLVNKIAAGEVVEKPINVVKELVENAVDAGAKHIVVEIAENLIKVSDDGYGISREDMEMCAMRHATSKIENFDDLEKVRSYGFRGEALASIAAVSKLVISSKNRESFEGYEMFIEGGEVRYMKMAACPQGTVVEVYDLFFNTPVRKKFLDMSENERIVEFLEKFALGTNVSVRLKMFDKILIDVYVQDALERMGQVYGLEVMKEMLPVIYESDGIRVEGYVSKPSLVRKDKSMQAVFVNGRLVENDEIGIALYDAYKSLLFVNRHPIVLLHFYLDGVDVNVHPTKKIVKFENPDTVCKVLFEALQNLFKTQPLNFTAKDTQIQEMLSVEGRRSVKVDNSRFVRDVQKGLMSLSEDSTKLSHFPEMKILGNVAKTFFLAETDDGLVIIDQHVVEERINYEKFMKQYNNKCIIVQDLIEAELIDFSTKDAMFVNNHLDDLRSYGFYLEEFGDNTFRLTKVPVIFSKVKGADLLRDLIVDFKDDDKEDFITMMACRKSVKAGDNVSISEMYGLLRELDKCDLPFTCPHGRPIMVKVTIADLERMFRRKGF